MYFRNVEALREEEEIIKAEQENSSHKAIMIIWISDNTRKLASDGSAPAYFETTTKYKIIAFGLSKLAK
ncbi:hypothetical protein ABNP44_10500 [Providencia rettgeri]